MSTIGGYGLSIAETSLADVAAALSTTVANLRYHASRSDQHKYRSFEIRAKGKLRQIVAPDDALKSLQRRFLAFLESKYVPRHGTQGFRKGHGIRKNASVHEGKRFVLNLDLQDFFPSISERRVVGLLRSAPFGLSLTAARVMARICCFQGVLPQGAPTSPIISNCICFRLDKAMQALASRRGCLYSRYADDITFSSNRPFTQEFVSSPDPDLQLGEQLLAIIEKEGFVINPNKTRLRSWYQRQVVTGLVVNSKVNVKREYAAAVRGMIHAWEKYGLAKAAARFKSDFNRKHRYPAGAPEFVSVVLGHLAYIRSIVGPDAPVYKRLIEAAVRADPTLASLKSDARTKLKQRYETCRHWGAARRGLELESILNDLLQLEGIVAVSPFTRQGGSEQIDGAFVVDAQHFIAECKWKGKVENLATCDVLSMKGQRGGGTVFCLLLSINGWSKHVESGLKRNPVKNVLLMDGTDLEACLLGEMRFGDLVLAKLRYLLFHSEAFMAWTQYVPR